MRKAHRASFPVTADQKFLDGIEATLDVSGPQCESRTEAIRPLLAQLDQSRRRIAAGEDLDEIGAARAPILSVLSPRLSQLRQCAADYNNLRQQHDYMSLTVGARKFYNGQLDTSDTARQLKAAYVRSQVSSRLTRFMEDAGLTVRAEDKAFAEAVNARESRHQTFLMAGCAAGCVLLLFLVLLWRRRRARDWITVDATTAAGRFALSGPAAATEGGAGNVLGGNYRIESELGRGGMGVIYEATDIGLRRKVAIKRLREEFYQDEAGLDAFLREAQLVASLRHPNIVEIYSIVKDKGRVYLVFEFVKGKTLSHILGAGRRLSLRSAKSVLRQTGAALDYAHGKRLIHRDLKPSNIMIASDGTAKVMDFGIAIVAKGTATPAARAQSLGTLAYMAPEQQAGTVRRESDLYALGVCFYEMVTGRLPFEGPNFLAQKQEMVYPAPSQVAADLPRELDGLVRRALHVDPEQRFHSASQFLGALEALPETPARA
ncbi:MAG TPA: serine/threonine-protein kinase [Elusimicrobiota bacterium]|jgi:hypothetical protein|nr:serine/threonine-protein kinase [Elusimicrobiota bacterium]